MTQQHFKIADQISSAPRRTPSRWRCRCRRAPARGPRRGLRLRRRRRLAARGRAAASGSQGGEEVDVGRRDPRRADETRGGPPRPTSAMRGRFGGILHAHAIGSATAQKRPKVKVDPIAARSPLRVQCLLLAQGTRTQVSQLAGARSVLGRCSTSVIGRCGS